MLKLLANSTSYGIFAEMNVQSYERPRHVICYGAEPAEFDRGTKSVEEPGTHFHPLLATLITGAARLMLSIAERLTSDNGIGWALCDTDSLALACPADMDEGAFLARAVGVTKWFDALNPYDDDKPLFKIEEQNYGLKNGSVSSGIREPLYAIAISAKRYVLFNLDKDNRPVIRKAVAHGLGHWRVPYTEHDAPTSIPAPTIKLSDIGADLWQHDLWHQIIMAELEGHPDQIDLSPLPGLDRAAVSRYSASTPALLHWFDTFNRGKPYAERVKAFNFLLAYQVSSTALYSAIASGEIDAEFIDDGLPAVVAPFDDDPVRAAKKCFDRRSGRPVPPSILATYREAIADYHLHSESKFENGETTDRGITERRRVQAVAVEYIGKEANRWEEQFYLGEMPAAQIEYGTSRKGNRQLLKVIAGAGRTFGKASLANAAQLSRQQFSAVLARDSEPRPMTIRSLLQAVISLEIERREKQVYDAGLIECLRRAVDAKGVVEIARTLRCDPSNLAKALNGTRNLSADLERRVARCFGVN